MAELKSIDPIEGLNQNQIQGIVLPCYENERPLQGLAGLVDWQLIGLFSRMIQAGFITGKPGECVYIPITHLSKSLHFILLGAGTNTKIGNRSQPLPKESMAALKKNLRNLNLERMAWSQKEFQAYTIPELMDSFQEIPLWIIH